LNHQKDTLPAWLLLAQQSQLKRQLLKGMIMSRPLNKTLWDKAIAAAKRKFDVYPSWVANEWAVRWYKKKGGQFAGKRTYTKPASVSIASLALEDLIKDTREMPKNNFLGELEILAKKLSYKKKQSLPDSDFAIVYKDKDTGKKVRKYPIPDVAHAINALARVSQFGNNDEKGIVRKAVYKRYPQLKENKAYTEYKDKHGKKLAAAIDNRIDKNVKTLFNMLDALPFNVDAHFSKDTLTIARVKGKKSVEMPLLTMIVDPKVAAKQFAKAIKLVR
jgi:hypothetical protein